MENEKKAIIILLAFFCMFCMVGCESNRMPMSATYYDGTSDGSTNHVVRIMYAEEKMYEKKNLDVLISSNKENVSFTITPEGKSPISVTLEKKEYWYSLQDILTGEGAIEYPSYKETTSQSFIIKSQQDMTLTFKSVIGDINQNVLANMEDISKEFQLEVKKSKEE